MGSSNGATWNGGLQPDFTFVADTHWWTRPDDHRLHSVRLTGPLKDTALDDVTFACGEHTAWAAVAGYGACRSLPRCAGCCRAAGVPEGVGAPKNSPKCQEHLGSEGTG